MVNLADDATVDDGANEVLAADKANVMDKTTVVDKAVWAEADESVAEEIEGHVSVVWVDDDLVVPFSLTKYSAIFADVKESFGIYEFNNQLGRFGTDVDN